MQSSPAIEPAAPPAASQRGVWWLLIVVAGLVLASVLFGRVLDQVLPQPKLPVLGSIVNDLRATERSGQEVKLSDLRGKVVVCAYLYTICPHGCAAVVGQMQKLQHDFGQRPDFHQVSITVVPDRDTPAVLSTYAEAMGVKPGDPWWFITGARDPLINFMTNDLKLQPCKVIPPEERLNPLDVFSHDLRIVVIDRHGQVRGYYEVFHPQPEIAQVMCEKLQRDVRTLLDHPNL
jgi:cytochrome oxidase Cu insertion factor (SCO1/SenC/PrrC family)